MNINEYKKYLQDVHGTLDDDPGTKQISARISRTYRETAHDMDEYKPDKKEDKSTLEPTTAAGDTLRPGSKSAEKGEKVKMKEGAADASAAGGKKPKKVVVEDEFEEGAADASAAGPSRKKKVVVEEEEVEEAVLQYFDNYFGDELNEDTSDEDIMEAVYDLIELRDAVCEAVGLEPKKNLTIDEKFMSPIKAFKTLRNTTGKGGKKVDAQLRQYGNRVTSTNIPISKYKKILPKALDLAIKNVSSGTPKVARGKATRAIADKGSFTLSQSGKKPVKRKPTDWEGRYDPTDGSY